MDETMVEALILVGDKLSPTRYDRLQTYLEKIVESVAFTRYHKRNHRTYLRVVCRRNDYDKLENAINNAPSAPSEELWPNVDLQCNLLKNEVNNYFNTCIDSSYEDAEAVKLYLQKQNREISTRLWVFVTKLPGEIEPNFRLIFSVPISQLGFKVTHSGKQFQLDNYTCDDGSDSDCSLAKDLDHYNEQKQRKRTRDVCLEDMPGPQLPAKRVELNPATNSPSTSAAYQFNRAECSKESADSKARQKHSRSRLAKNLPSTSSPQGQPINPIPEDAILQILKIVQDIQKRL